MASGAGSPVFIVIIVDCSVTLLREWRTVIGCYIMPLFQRINLHANSKKGSNPESVCYDVILDNVIELMYSLWVDSDSPRMLWDNGFR